jgi:CPA2 family monovalent cation:H+ antiporter-2
MHDAPLITTIVAGLVLAFVFGAIANRLRLPPLVGYLIAGVAVGPYTPGFIADAEIALELSEIGVILLMFGVGLHFSLKDLISVQAVAVPGALLRIAGGTAMGAILGAFWGWPLLGGLVFGLALSVASTVVLIKALQDRHLVNSERGRISTGWVIVEDIAMILALVLIPATTGLFGVEAAVPDDPFVSLVERMLNVDLGVVGVVAVTVIKFAAFIGFMFVVGRRLIPMILHYTAHTGSRELFRLAVLAIALGVAAGAAYLFGVSLALGAFFAGMILSESELSHRAAEESLPLRDAFAVLFFVSVGMLFDPTIIWTDPLPLLATLLVILAGKSVIAYFSLVAFKRTPSTALAISASLAQIGEFSFILATLGLSLGILPVEGRDLIVAGAIISIILNPLLIWGADRMKARLDARLPKAEPDVPIEPSLGDVAPAVAEPAAPPEEEAILHPTALTDHTVLIGYGRVGTVIAEGLKVARKPFLVIEDSDDRIKAARDAGFEVIVGNAASSGPLRLANIEGAQTVIVAIPNAFEAGQAVEQCRRASPTVKIIARAHSDEEEAHLMHLGANTALLGEREIGLAMLDLVNPNRSEVAGFRGLDAVADAILPRDAVAKPIAWPERPAEPLRDVDPEAFARAIGAPPPAPPTAPEQGPPAEVADASAVEVEALPPPEEPEGEPPSNVIQLHPPVAQPAEAEEAPPVEKPAAAPDEPEAGDGPPAPPKRSGPATAKGRRPARTPATPFNPETPPKAAEPAAPAEPKAE